MCHLLIRFILQKEHNDKLNDMILEYKPSAGDVNHHYEYDGDEIFYLHFPPPRHFHLLIKITTIIIIINQRIIMIIIIIMYHHYHHINSSSSASLYIFQPKVSINHG